ncbi:MAG: putative RND-type efflux pump outer membrane protein [Ferruginibacter sp.]|nr:putative RND-type efflux pump outer membrane protein [Ferruginibacter sp.]
MQRLFTLLIILIFTSRVTLYAQTTPDTSRFTLAEAEQVFMQKNLLLLAAKYNIDANKALAEQAKLWDNPILTTDQNIYDGKKGDGKFLRHDAVNGQVFIQITQLIKTARKRSKLAALANDNTTLAIEQLNDILRNLRYALRSDLLEIDHQLKIKQLYDIEIIELQRLIKGMDEELKAGNIALKDNMRLKALLFTLQNEEVNITAAMMPPESELKLLLQSSEEIFIAPKTNYQWTDLTTGSLPVIDSLIALAINNRPEAKIARATMALQNHNVVYQKALAKPDVTIGTEYDQHSSYNPNYIGLMVALPINIFNRNQGNIKSAELTLKQQELLNNYQYSKITNEVSASYKKLLFFQQVNNIQQLDFAKRYEELFQNMVKSYRARQISLLEFIDFADAYKDTRLKLLEQNNNLLKAAEELNYSINANAITIQ